VGTRKQFLLLVAVFGVAIAAASFNFGGEASATVPGINTLISVNTSGTADGSTGDNAYLRNLATNTTSLISVSTSGTQNDSTTAADAISETGRYVIMESTATNLVDGTTISGGHYQEYLRDTKNNTTSLLTEDTSGNPGNGDSSGFGVSYDGRFVLIGSNATNLNGGLTDGHYHYYLLDRNTGTFTAVDKKYDGTHPATSGSLQASMSCDGSIIAFVDSAQLTTQSTSHYDIYLYDGRNGATLTNLTASTNGAAMNPSVSCNGDYVGLASAGVRSRFKRYNPDERTGFLS
jgi:hypothetical protein